MSPVSNCFDEFHRPRLFHVHPHHEQCVYGRYSISTWKDPEPGVKQQARKLFFTRREEASPSPPGLGKLPYELLDAIFRRLCGAEVAATRLVNTEWELAGRPFFANLHLVKSVFWITSSQLYVLDILSQKFGAYMQELYIAADSFTISGISQAWKQYLRYRYSHVFAAHYEASRKGYRWCSKSMFEIKSHYLGQWFKAQEWHTHCDQSGSRRFFWYYARNIASQKHLRLGGKDIERLASVLGRIPRCEIKTVSLSYEACRLNINVQTYGRAAPAYAFEMALYCSRREKVSRAPSCKRVDNVLEEALARRRLICSDGL